MPLDVRFAIISDPHIALPETVWQHPNRFHLCELSIPAIETVFAELSQIDLDFLLLPGDLTQHGEPTNHAWLADRLAQLPYPAYVIPGNHDIPQLEANETSIAMATFPYYYRNCGYTDPTQFYYTCQPCPGIRLIGLNSNTFDAAGNQQGVMDQAQLVWLQEVLANVQDELVLVMVHHNVLEHIPGQANDAMARRYILENAPTLVNLLQQAGVQLVFTGHLHVQDVAYANGLYDITTGSLVSYPHPYRMLHLRTDAQGQLWLQVESGRIKTLPGWDMLQQMSREWMGSKSRPFMLRLLMQPPLCLAQADAESFVDELQYFWADVANGDARLEFPNLPANVCRYFQTFSAIDADGSPQWIDNHIALRLR
jgi:3',5'-cyclic AMP phosphodiesterase CpdA